MLVDDIETCTCISVFRPHFLLLVFTLADFMTIRILLNLEVGINICEDEGGQHGLANWGRWYWLWVSGVGSTSCIQQADEMDKQSGKVTVATEQYLPCIQGQAPGWALPSSLESFFFKNLKALKAKLSTM